MMHEAKLRFLERPTDSKDQQFSQGQPVLPTKRDPLRASEQRGT